MNEKKPKVGDTVFIEQAWEDETGAYHDENAKILAISTCDYCQGKGETGGKDGCLHCDGSGQVVDLDFYEASEEVKKFLAGCDFNIDQCQ